MQKESKYIMKSYDELFFTDDFLFNKIMRNPEIAKGVVQNLLGIKVKKIEFVTSQYSIDELYNGKGIRLDAYLEDEDKSVKQLANFACQNWKQNLNHQNNRKCIKFLLEMQTVIKKDEGLRMRYYQSMMDIDHLNRGEGFRKLKKSYIVFICLDDPFGDGKPVYNFATKELDGGRILNDRIHKVIYNASSFEKAENPNVRAFLEYLEKHSATDPLTKEIQTAVDSCKNHQKWRAEYMLWKDQIREWKDEAREDGLEEGRVIGLKEGERRGARNKSIETTKQLLKMNILTVEQIATATQLSVDEILKIKQEMK